jgi:hypothetical protein
MVNTLGLDTLRFIVPSKTLSNFLSRYHLKATDSIKNELIFQYLAREIQGKSDYKIEAVKISQSNNLSGYLLIKQNFESVATAKGRKKQKSFYSEVIFTGLRQPSKSIKIETYEIARLFVKRFKVSSLDITFDGLTPLAIHGDNLARLQWLFRDYITMHKTTAIESTTFYINRPRATDSDTDRFIKIKVYDKYLKESRYKKLPDEVRDWKRLEVTIKIDCKFGGMSLDDYILDVLSIAKRLFEFDDFSLDYLLLQIKLLNDKRTHRGIKSL